MLSENNRIIILGTGNAIATRCYNTCFVLQTTEGMLLVDAGGGNGILSQLEKAQIALSDIHEMFITHAHTDHILGAVWMVRMIIHRMKNKEYNGTFTVYGHDKVLNVLKQICHMTLQEKDLAYIGKSVFFHELKDKESFHAGGMDMQCFDILSTKEKQFGFRALLPDGTVLVCLGDEPYNENNRLYVENADWLLCEAFCLYRDREIFKPYEKHHSTALEAGVLAEKLNVKNLLLYHTEDRTLTTRKRDYTEEARRNFTGNVFVPDDLETMIL
jgi:ribonuclease Z